MLSGRFLLPVLRQERAIVLACLAAVALAAWAWLLLGAGIDMRTMPMAGMMMPPAPHWSLGYTVLVLIMWGVMMVAMMLPSAAPVTLLVAGIAGQRAPAGSGGADALWFVVGYLLVWFGFAAAATALQWALDAAGLLSDRWALANAVLAGFVLVAAGVYQWTPLKARCLRHCRSPLEFILFHWRGGALGALSSGLRHAVFCVGCCWMLMALLFVGGIMSLAWIGAITLLVLVEKTLPWGGRTGRLAGGALAAWGIATLAMTI